MLFRSQFVKAASTKRVVGHDIRLPVYVLIERQNRSPSTNNILKYILFVIYFVKIYILLIFQKIHILMAYRKFIRKGYPWETLQ